MREYLRHARALVREISTYFTDCRTVEQYMDAVTSFNLHHKHVIHCDHGLTRVVLIGSDFVVKIDYGRPSSWGDCATEYNFYQFAKHEHKEWLFARIDKYSYDNRDYYIMPFVPNVNSGYDIENLLDYDDMEWIDEHLFDLHDGNFGFDDDFNPIIIDYACVRSSKP